ncbi:MAG: HEAT repeat domain-containing protein [Planctomycetes bacterium]|nr:HEAT repeat domain-containing protein [Planctomycetota bacterium]
MKMSFLVCLLLAGAQPATEREPHPLAPSLPRLTKAESQHVDAVIEKFIQYDIGKLKGPAGKKALDDFNRLGPEATFNLINGLNRAANMESSCPAVIIARKLAGTLGRTSDLKLLEFARENIGADVTAKRHINVLRDLQTGIILRRGYLQRRAAVSGSVPGLASLSDDKLEKAISQERRTPQLKSLLTEASNRVGSKAVEILLQGISSENPQVSKLSSGLLANNLRRQPPSVLKDLLKHDRPVVRKSAAQQIGARRLPYGEELMPLLKDSDEGVRQAARQALDRLR